MTSGTSYVDTGLAPGTYYYRVIAEDAAGNASPASAEVPDGSLADTTPPSSARRSPPRRARTGVTLELERVDR